MSTSHAGLKAWVNETAKLTQPDRIHWCDGSENEYRHLIGLMLESGDLLPLNKQSHPGCYLHRSHPSDVARTENLTFICTPQQDDVGPTNNWMAPAEGHKKVDPLFAGSMKGRTMYVVPYVMGPLESKYASPGVELTDSPYVAASMRLMTRMGSAALKRIEENGT
ncbi:MAG TPA: phosphoenolpyruvate carboxykinase, partial [bacterium]